MASNTIGRGTAKPLKGLSIVDEHNSDHTEIPEDVLISRCRAGNMVAFGQLIEKYQDRLFNAIFRMVNNYDDAQELTQEAFVRALKGIKRFRGNARFYTWLFRIGINLSISHRRRQRVRLMTTGPNVAKSGQAAALMEMADAKSPSPLREAQIRERHQQVLDALERLEPQARAVVVLRDIEQLDYAEIARILEVPTGTVKSRLFRARMAVREQLSQGQ